MTKEEKQALDQNTKEIKNLASKMDRVVRQMGIANVLKAKEIGVDINSIIPENDKFENNLKQHAYEVSTKKANKEENN